MLIIGDIHGKTQEYTRIVSATEEPTIQLGDFGFGFVAIPEMNPKDRFIRGNHDSPALARIHPNYLGDYGWNEELGVFFVSGAWSIDREWRTVGRDWWPDEELRYSELYTALNQFEEKKPNVMVSHECPQSILDSLHSHREGFKNKTAQGLQAMFEVHQPEYWFFGHHHVYSDQIINGTRFICLPELETYSF